ncbi:MAG: 3D domain-containing protein [Gemmatimonadetes bacterium]|nr:3D domain-containing protein [Gemmatimonadota bacterium]
MTSPSAPRPVERRRRTVGLASFATMAGLLIVGTATMRTRAPEAAIPLALSPVVVLSPMHLDGALVVGARRDWAVKHDGPLHYGDPVPVELTAYCLQGTTRRDRYVREGIVAADPRLFPLGRYVEVYVGRVYYGRFLVDDTGDRIRNGVLDIWTPTCRDARLFGRQRGTAVLVPRPRGAMDDTLLTGRLGGAAVQ